MAKNTLDTKSGHVPTEYVEAHKSDDLRVGPLPYILTIVAINLYPWLRVKIWYSRC